MEASAIDRLLACVERTVVAVGALGVVSDTVLRRAFPSVSAEAEDCDCPSRETSCRSGCEPYGELYIADFWGCDVDEGYTACYYHSHEPSGICC